MSGLSSSSEALEEKDEIWILQTRWNPQLNTHREDIFASAQAVPLSQTCLYTESTFTSASVDDGVDINFRLPLMNDLASPIEGVRIYIWWVCATATVDRSSCFNTPPPASPPPAPSCAVLDSSDLERLAPQATGHDSGLDDLASSYRGLRNGCDNGG